jgi:hypothetical protein
VRRSLGAVLGPLWVTTFREPVREGRLRLDGLGPVQKQLARVGLVALALLLVSTLLAATWRRGDLLPVDIGASHDFVPPGVFALSVVGMFLAWVLMTWGALAGSASVRLVAAIGYLLVNSNFSVADGLDIDSGLWVLEHGRRLLQVGQYAPVVALAVAAATARARRLDRWVVPVARLVCALGAAALFLGLLWIHAGQVDAGQDPLMPSIVGSSVLNLHLLLLPLLYVASVAVIDFALDITSSLATPTGALRRRWIALLLVLALAAAKLWFEVGAKLDYWRVTAANQPQALIRTTACLAMLAAVVTVVTRFRRSDDTLAAKEDLIQGGAAILAAPWVLKVAAISAGIFVALQLDSTTLAQRAADFPAEWLSSWGVLIVGALAVVAGIVLMRRSDGGIGDELGSGMIVVGSWNAVALSLSNSNLSLGFSYPAVDVVVTVGVIVLLAVRWRRMDVRFLVTLGTVLGFSWLVTSRGDYLSFVGGLVGLSTVLVLVFGIAWTLLSGSSFTSGSSSRLPRNARPMLYLGYLLLSVVILHWDAVTHAFVGSDPDALVAYYFLGIPIAAWLLGRRIVSPPEAPAAS